MFGLRRIRRRPFIHPNIKAEATVDNTSSLEERSNEFFKAETKNYISIDSLSWQDAFSRHVSRYIGQTVTVFVKGGGLSGFGFTGTLLSINAEYIQLILQIGPPPSCALGNSCRPFYNNLKPEGSIFRTLGSTVYILIDKIAAFVHISV